MSRAKNVSVQTQQKSIKNRPSGWNQRGGKQLYRINDTIALDKLHCIISRYQIQVPGIFMPENRRDDT